MAIDHEGQPVERDAFDTAIPSTIVCPDCGGTAHLISHLDERGGVEAGESVAYRCADCLDRWDVIWDEPDSEQ